MRLRKSSLITKLVVLALMIYAVVTIVTLQPTINELEDESAALAAEIAALQQQNLELQEDIRGLGTDEAVKEIARERLNLVEHDEVVFIDGSK